MRISDIEFYLLSLDAPSVPRGAQSLLVRVATESMLEGWGESCVSWTAGQLEGQRQAVLAAMVGHNIFDIEEALALDALADAALACAVEMALWDLVGRATGEPLCHLWGGAYRRRVPVAVRVATDPPDSALRHARELAEHSLATQIITSCGEVQGDVSAIAQVREAAGKRACLRLDGASQYTVEEARDLCSQLEDDSLQFFLDPLLADRVDELAALSRQVNVPLGVSASITGPRDVASLSRSRGPQHVVIELARVGGIARARQCATVAAACGLSPSLGRCISGGIAMAAMLQLAASTPALSLANECTCHERRDELLREPLEIADGMMTLPQSPGLGVEVDRAKVEQLQVSAP
jgi:L-alanine-DL-glutamate epimerase-like enolase superfamily enzyme